MLLAMQLGWAEKPVEADCASVVASATRRIWAIGERRPEAGIWRKIREGVEVSKTKAHRTKAEAEAEGDLVGWIGNGLADSWAKMAARKHRCARTAADRKARCKEVVGDLGELGAYLAGWPDKHMG